MGYYRASNGTKSFISDDDENILHLSLKNCPIPSDILEDEIIAHFCEKNNFPRETLKLTFDAENIHMHCIGYDLYDPSDWEIYLIIRRIE